MDVNNVSQFFGVGTVTPDRPLSPASGWLALVPRSREGMSPERRRRLRGRIQRARRLAQTLEEELDGLETEYDDALAATAGTPAAAERQAAVSRALREGVTRVVLAGVRRGTLAHLAGFVRPAWLGESAILPALLKALCLPGTPRGRDRLVGYKSAADLIDAIGEKSGRRITPHSLRTHVGLLRRKLDDAGMDGLLIQTCRGAGYRLVLKRDGEVIERR